MACCRRSGLCSATLLGSNSESFKRKKQRYFPFPARKAHKERTVYLGIERVTYRLRFKLKWIVYKPSGIGLCKEFWVTRCHCLKPSITSNLFPCPGDALVTAALPCKNAVKRDIPEHFENFRSTLRDSHGCYTRDSYLPRLPNRTADWG